ncbi:MAG: hypothetical protein ACOYT9_02810 [Patescibacteria group bacterium]
MREEPADVFPGMILQTLPQVDEREALQTYANPDNPRSQAKTHVGANRLLVVSVPELILGGTLVSPGGDRIRATLRYVVVVDLDVHDDIEQPRIQYLRLQGDQRRRTLAPRFVDSGERVSAEDLAAYNIGNNQ